MTDLSGWTPPPRPPRAVFEGRYARLEPLERAHLPGLWEAQREAPEIWHYIPTGPFADEAALGHWVDRVSAEPDPLQFAVRMADGRLGGTMSFLRIQPEAGSIEIGYIVFSPRLQRTREATEAVFLMMRWCFEAGYRRFEWKCDAANLASRRAAERFGFSYEGVFRQAAVVKGRNRDTAWFACIDREWPRLKAAFEGWLDPGNFDPEGCQLGRLGDATAPILVARDPALAG